MRRSLQRKALLARWLCATVLPPFSLFGLTNFGLRPILCWENRLIKIRSGCKCRQWASIGKEKLLHHIHGGTVYLSRTKTQGLFLQKYYLPAKCAAIPRAREQQGPRTWHISKPVKVTFIWWGNWRPAGSTSELTMTGTCTMQTCTWGSSQMQASEVHNGNIVTT